MENVLIYSDKLAGYEYPADHPFKPERARHFLELLNRYTLMYENNQKIIDPDIASKDLLGNFHHHEYIELLETCDKGEYSIEMLQAGLGTNDNPIEKGIYEFSAHATGGTHKGAMMLLNNEARFVFNPVGGFHHAGPNHSEGFCYINDIAVVINDLVAKGLRVAYIDVDVHHGNGVQDAFYLSHRVLTISFHESGKSLYPWSGFENSIGVQEGAGYNINVPLLKGTDDEVYLKAFEELVPPLVNSFKPDIVFAEIGADVHKDDPLAHLDLTSNGYEKIIKIINEISPKILATGGGGYNCYETASLWTLAWAAFCGLEPHDGFAGSVGGMMFGPEAQAGNLRDEPFSASSEVKENCLAHTTKIIEYIKKNVFPVHGL
ncbi:MAG: hypothetical protein GY754_45570 [bacterium]|nr:hypothetical protein [bacterium]